MEELIKQCFLHVDVIGPHVMEGHYDLIGSNGEIILPIVWESLIEPGWSITMHMWPLPEPKPNPLGPPPGHYFNPTKRPSKNSKNRHRGPPPPPPGWPGPPPLPPPSTQRAGLPPPPPPGWSGPSGSTQKSLPSSGGLGAPPIIAMKPPSPNQLSPSRKK